MNKGIISLAFGSLAIGMTEFSMMGILPDIAKDLSISIPSAAHLIALYALGVVVGAPILVLLTSKYPPKNVLMFFMILFFVFNGLFCLAPNLWSIQLTRFMSGLPHGAFFGVGAVVAAKLAKKGKEAQAISIMFTGMTLANLAGVPLATYIGHHHSWRISYAIISLLGLLCLATIYLWMPKISSEKENNMMSQLSFFKRHVAWLLFAIIAIGTGGLFAWISYIAPLVTTVSKLSENIVPFIMVLIGLGMCIGNLLGGKLADTISPSKAAIVCFMAMAGCLFLVYFLSSLGWTAYPLAFVTGLVAFMIGSPTQMMLIREAKGAATLAAAAGQAAFNLGNTMGAFFGGIPIQYNMPYNTPSIVGIVMASIGAILTFIYIKYYHNNSLAYNKVQ